MAKTILALLVLAASAAATPTGSLPDPCVTGTLESYIALGGKGCLIGTEFAFRDFTFSVISSTTGAIPLPAAQILVTPVMGSNGPQLTFLSIPMDGFSVPAGQSIVYSLTYNVDPHPIILSFEMDLFSETPVFPGFARIDAALCIGALFPCNTGIPDNSVSVEYSPNLIQLSDSTEFDPVAIVDVLLKIELNAINGGSSQIAGFGNGFGMTGSGVPEPSTWAMAFSALAGLALYRRRRT